MRAVKCNLCGADDYMVRFPKGVAQLHRIVQCNRCGLMYANPQELVNCECYESDAHPKVFDEVEARQYLQKQHVQLPDSEKALRVLNGFFPNAASSSRLAVIAVSFSTASAPMVGR